jgi:hypothetical protein
MASTGRVRRACRSPRIEQVKISPRSAWGRMLHSFGRMLCAFGAPPLSGPTAPPRARRDALEEAWASLRKERDALREPRDALLEPRDALAIREDAVRRRGRDSRRVTRVSRTSPRAPSISEGAARTRASPPTQREATLRAHLGTLSMGFETPNAKRTMPTVKRRSPRRHPSSLQRFSLEELASFTNEGTFGADATRSRSRACP